MHVCAGTRFSASQLFTTNEAEGLYAKIVHSGDKILVKEHPHNFFEERLFGIMTLAHAYSASNRLEDSRQLYTRVLGITQKLLGEAHFNTLVCMDGLAGVNLDRGRLEEAEKLYFRAMEIQMKFLGENNPETLHTMTQLGIVYYGRGYWTNPSNVSQGFWKSEGTNSAKSTQIPCIL
jgi:tetratricopeptide (TPR) repeat protein